MTLGRWLRIAAGLGMLVVGVLGWLLPVIPGWAFFIPGLIVLSREFAWAKRVLEWLKRRVPRRFSRP